MDLKDQTLKTLHKKKRNSITMRKGNGIMKVNTNLIQKENMMIDVNGGESMNMIVNKLRK